MRVFHSVVIRKKPLSKRPRKQSSVKEVTCILSSVFPINLIQPFSLTYTTSTTGFWGMSRKEHLKERVDLEKPCFLTSTYFF